MCGIPPVVYRIWADSLPVAATDERLCPGASLPASAGGVAITTRAATAARTVAARSLITASFVVICA
jgi:hypothetical protein